jgi:hypothetical protein
MDPDLNHGCAYFVEEREYKKYLKNYHGKTEPVSTFLLIEFQNSKFKIASRS